MNALNGTALPVATTSDMWQVEVIGMGDTPSQRDKAAPTGEVTYSTGGIMRRRGKDGQLKADKSASIHSLNGSQVLELGQVYRAQGRIWCQPYESNGRMALSITCESFIPAAAAVAGRGKAQEQAA